jgi:hypothetical protein
MDEVPQIKAHFLPLLRHIVYKKTQSIINGLIKKDDEESLLNKILYIIPDFTIDEFIKKVREENSIFIDYD